VILIIKVKKNYTEVAYTNTTTYNWNHFETKLRALTYYDIQPKYNYVTIELLLLS